MTPALLGDTCRLERNGEEVLDGIWVGDAITPTNDAPGEGYIDITPEYTIWPYRHPRRLRGLPLTRGLDRLVDRPTRFLVALSSINDAPCKWNSHKLAKQLANLTNNSLNPLKKLASCEKRDSPMDAKELKTAIRQLK